MAGPATTIDAKPDVECTTGGKSLSIAVFTRFYPNVGGIETVAELLAREWVAAGHAVTIVTDVAAAPGDTKSFPFPVFHRPGPSELLRVVRNCDLAVHHNISLKALWPLLLVRKPLVAIHHDRYFPFGVRSRPWRERAKVWIARHWAHNVCISHATRASVGCDGPVIHDLYDCETFRNLEQRRERELVFLGRLVSDKGVDVLLDALSELKRQGITPLLTIIGDGPERADIERRIDRLGLESQVTLLGKRGSDEIVRILNAHRIMVVPSVFDEGFGVVALEGAACGCVIVGADSGGLPEAIGPCGVSFPKRDHRRLATLLAELLLEPARLEKFRAAAPAHLAQHQPFEVAAKYIEVFQKVVQPR